MRRHVFDSFVITLANIELDETDLFLRDFLIMKYGLHHLVAEFELLTIEGAVIKKIYRWHRKFFVDPVYNAPRQAQAVFQRLIARPGRKWVSSLEWDEKTIPEKGIFVTQKTGTMGKSIVVMLEPENMSPLYISEALDHNENQFVWLTSSIAAVFKKLSAACLEGE